MTINDASRSFKYAIGSATQLSDVYWRVGGIGQNSFKFILKVAEICMKAGLMVSYPTITLGSMRHTGVSMFSRAQIPDSVASIVMGHTVEAHRAKSANKVDRNMACYRRDLMQSVRDHVRVASIQANLGNLKWSDPVDETLVSEVGLFCSLIVFYVRRAS